MPKFYLIESLWEFWRDELNMISISDSTNSQLFSKYGIKSSIAMYKAEIWSGFWYKGIIMIWQWWEVGKIMYHFNAADFFIKTFSSKFQTLQTVSEPIVLLPSRWLVTGLFFYYNTHQGSVIQLYSKPLFSLTTASSVWNWNKFLKRQRPDNCGTSGQQHDCCI